MNRFGWVVSAAALCAWAGSAVADSITPGSVTATLGVGESTTVKKTVTVSAGTPTSSKVDVFFLADTTGSMGGPIGAVSASASSIMSAVAGLGDVQFAVGEYKDDPLTSGDPYAYRLNQNITGNTAAVQTGINAWSASGGGDYPEANLFGLDQVANGTSWRAGSERILVWFGDAPGHDPSLGVSLTDAENALNAKGIKAQAINVGTLDLFAPNGAGFTGLNDLGQASAIASATGGAFLDGINTSTIVDTITAAITTAVETYSKVGIDTSEVPAGVTVTVIPPDISGSFDRSIERSFNFDVTFTGVTPGVHNFNLYGTVDGGRVATEADSITVRGVSPAPDGGSSLFLLGTALGGLAMLRRKLA